MSAIEIMLLVWLSASPAAALIIGGAINFGSGNDDY